MPVQGYPGSKYIGPIESRLVVSSDLFWVQHCICLHIRDICWKSLVT